MFCKNCGAQLVGNGTVCTNCGCAVGTGLNFCANCGGQLAPNASVCSSCGSPANFGVPNNNPYGAPSYGAPANGAPSYGAPAYSAPAFDPTKAPFAVPKKRNIAVCIILSLVTFGIYAIYWAIMLAKESCAVRDSNDSGTLEIVLMLFVSFVGVFLTERKLAEGMNARGMAKEDKSIIYLVLGLFGLGIVAWAMMQSDLNRVADTFPAA